MIALIIIGLVVLTGIAIIVGMLEHTQKGTWRAIAAERRRNWEARALELHRTDSWNETCDKD